MLVAESAPTPPAGAIPVTLGGQLRRHMPTFVNGTIYLVAFNALRAGIDLVMKRGIDDLEGGRFDATWRIGAVLVGLALVAVFVRVT